MLQGMKQRLLSFTQNVAVYIQYMVFLVPLFGQRHLSKYFNLLNIIKYLLSSDSSTYGLEIRPSGI